MTPRQMNQVLCDVERYVQQLARKTKSSGFSDYKDTAQELRIRAWTAATQWEENPPHDVSLKSYVMSAVYFFSLGKAYKEKKQYEQKQKYIAKALPLLEEGFHNPGFEVSIIDKLTTENILARIPSNKPKVQAVISKVAQGLPRKVIAEQVGLSKVRVMQIIQKYRKENAFLF